MVSPIRATSIHTSEEKSCVQQVRKAQSCLWFGGFCSGFTGFTLFFFLLEFFPMRQKVTVASGRGKRKCRGPLPPQRFMRGRSEEEQEAPSAGKSPLSIQRG